MRCSPCGHLQHPFWVGTEKYDRAYLDRYAGYEGQAVCAMLNSLRWNMVSKEVGFGGTVLDWGCGAGSFINHAPPQYKAIGYEINPNSPYHDPAPRVHMGSDISAVTLWDVLEHMADPAEFLKSLRCKHVFISTPDSGSVALSAIRHWKHFRPDEHQHYFHLYSLHRLLHRCGYEIIDTHHAEGAIRDPEHPYAIMSVTAVRM